MTVKRPSFTILGLLQFGQRTRHLPGLVLIATSTPFANPLLSAAEESNLGLPHQGSTQQGINPASANKSGS